MPQNKGKCEDVYATAAVNRNLNFRHQTFDLIACSYYYGASTFLRTHQTGSVLEAFLTHLTKK
jgi:tRNA G10  N-methylase Trm11